MALAAHLPLHRTRTPSPSTSVPVSVHPHFEKVVMGTCSLLGVWFLRALSRCLHGPLTAPLAGGGAAPPSRSPAELLLAHTSPGPGSVAPVPASSFRETLSGTSRHICVARRVSIQPYQMLLKMCGPGERPRHEEGSSPYLLGPS